MSTLLRSRSRRGFTLVELLVVVAIVMLLLAILLISVGGLLDSARGIQCMANQRQIGVALNVYCTDHNGRCFDHRNWGRWLDPEDYSDPIDPDHPEAYWGVMYATYADGGSELFHCPQSVRIDPDRADPVTLMPRPSNCYGLNGYGIWFSDSFQQFHFGRPGRIAIFEQVGGQWRGRSIFQVRYPTTTLFAHDAYESVLDGNGDTLDDWYQYDNYGADDRTGEEIRDQEYLRHGGACNCIWFDGHVSKQHKDKFRAEWYLGQRCPDVD